MGKIYLKNKKQLKNLNSVGFTIVELLVVIVVIGILAAITIVSYSGITQRAKSTALQSDLTNAKTTLQLYQTLYGSYPTIDPTTKCPAAPSTIDSNYCLKTSPGNTLSYNMSNGTTFVLTETDSNGTKNIITNSSGVGISLGSGVFYSVMAAGAFMDFNDNLVPAIVPSGNSNLYKITFTSGALSGLSYNISSAYIGSWNGKQYFSFSPSMPNSPTTGDTFSVLLINP